MQWEIMCARTKPKQLAVVWWVCTCLVEATGGQGCAPSLALALAKTEKMDALFSSDYFFHPLLNFHNETTTFEMTLTASQAAGELPRLLWGAQGSKERVPADARVDMRAPAPFLTFPWLAQLLPWTVLKVHGSLLHGRKQC